MKAFITAQSKYKLDVENINSVDRYFVSQNEYIATIPANIQRLFVKNYDSPSNLVSFGNQFVHLKLISINHNSLMNVTRFEIDGLPSLEILNVSEQCFRMDSYDIVIQNSICRIVNCPKLQTLNIDNGSFPYFKSFELSNLISLKFISFGSHCFKYADELCLKGEFGIKIETYIK